MAVGRLYVQSGSSGETLPVLASKRARISWECKMHIKTGSACPITCMFQVSSQSDDFRLNLVHLAKLCQFWPVAYQDFTGAKNVISLPDYLYIYVASFNAIRRLLYIFFLGKPLKPVEKTGFLTYSTRKKRRL